MTIDVFGLTATDTTDMGIGQQWEKFVDQADVVLPMVYPSHFAPGTYKLANPNAAPYATIDHALGDAARRSRGHRRMRRSVGPVVSGLHARAAAIWRDGGAGRRCAPGTTTA